MEVEFRNVVAPEVSTQLTEVGCMGHLVEGPVDQRSSADRGELGPSARRRLGSESLQTCRLRVEPMARTGQPPETLNDGSFPTGDIADEDFENERSSFAAPIEDRARNVCAASSSIEFVYEPSSHEVADIRNSPVVAKLDELVFPQPIDTAARDGGLLSKNLDDAAQYVGIFRKSVFI